MVTVSLCSLEDARAQPFVLGNTECAAMRERCLASHSGTEQERKSTKEAEQEQRTADKETPQTLLHAAICCFLHFSMFTTAAASFKSVCVKSIMFVQVSVADEKLACAVTSRLQCFSEKSIAAEALALDRVIELLRCTHAILPPVDECLLRERLLHP